MVLLYFCLSVRNWVEVIERERENIRNKSRDRNCLISKQTEYIYEKVELGSLINKDTIKKERDSDVELGKIDDNSGGENLCRELIVNNVSKVEKTLS